MLLRKLHSQEKYDEYKDTYMICIELECEFFFSSINIMEFFVKFALLPTSLNALKSFVSIIESERKLSPLLVRFEGGTSSKPKKTNKDISLLTVPRGTIREILSTSSSKPVSLGK
jgi:hypothetical protein